MEARVINENRANLRISLASSVASGRIPATAEGDGAHVPVLRDRALAS